MMRQHQFRKVELVSVVHPGRERGRARADDAMRGKDARLAGAALPPRPALRRRYGLQRGQDVRPRSLATGRAGVARDQFLLELPRLPGPPHERAVPRRATARGVALCPYTERLRRRGGPRADRRSWRTTSRPTAPFWFLRCFGLIWAGWNASGGSSCVRSPVIAPEDLRGRTLAEITELARRKGLVQDPDRRNRYSIRSPERNVSVSIRDMWMLSQASLTTTQTQRFRTSTVTQKAGLGQEGL